MTFLSNRAAGLSRPRPDPLVAEPGVDKPPAKPSVSGSGSVEGAKGILKSGYLAGASRTTPLTRSDIFRILNGDKHRPDDSLVFGHSTKSIIRVIGVDFKRALFWGVDEKEQSHGFTFEFARNGAHGFTFIGKDGKLLEL